MVADKGYIGALYNQKLRLQKSNGLVRRSVFDHFNEYFHKDNRINIVSGLRRSGKSTLLRQLIDSLGNCIFVNFEDERLLNFTVDDFELLNEAAIKVYGETDYYFFDEIQNVPQFELFVRRLNDEGKKVVLTGSNSSLLSMELGTRLTGRYKSFELYPFSFSEYLAFKDCAFDESSFYVTEQKVALTNHFDDWMNSGGLPEYLKYGDEYYVKTLFDNIIFRDIVARYGIKKIAELQQLVHLLTSNLSLPVTYNSLKNSLGLSNADTVREYISYLSNSWLFFELRRYSHSLKQQLRSPRKIYMVDISFNRLIGFNTSENLGRRLENVVYVELRKQADEIFYFQDKYECDFVVKKIDGSVSLFQVCYDLNDGNRKRELSGLVEAIDFFKADAGTVLTYAQEESFVHEGKHIEILPVWKWMLAMDL